MGFHWNLLKCGCIINCYPCTLANSNRSWESLTLTYEKDRCKHDINIVLGRKLTFHKKLY